jgi:phosphodiesterase/alkaline phosphatase D-like protein
MFDRLIRFKRRKVMNSSARVSLLILFASFLSYGQGSCDNAKRSVAMAPFREPAKIIQGPVIVGTGADWAVIEWTSNAAGRSSSVVYAGTNKIDLRRADQTTEPVKMSEVASYQEQQYTHLVRLNHLESGTTYYFRIDLGPGFETGPSTISQLTTTKRRGLTTSGTSIQ